MSAAVSSASVKLPNGVLVSIGDAEGSTNGLFAELVVLLGDEAAKNFMSQVRAAFLGNGVVTPARVNETVNTSSSGASWNQGNGGYQGREQTSAPQGGDGHYCAHGEMNHKTGNRQSDNKWYELWECPKKTQPNLPGPNTVCETQWPPKQRR